MKTGIVFLTVVMVILASSSPAEQVKGAKEMVLYGGKMGSVPFPHHRHQLILADCNNCHRLFPHKSGIIQRLIRQDQLKKKQVMGQCRDCHKDTRRSGKKAGPIKCRECHQKQEMHDAGVRITRKSS